MDATRMQETQILVACIREWAKIFSLTIFSHKNGVLKYPIFYSPFIIVLTNKVTIFFLFKIYIFLKNDWVNTHFFYLKLTKLRPLFYFHLAKCRILFQLTFKMHDFFLK